MANVVEIVVKAIDKATPSLAQIGKAFAGLGIVAAGAIGVGVAAPLAAAGLALGAFGAVAIPTLDKVKKAFTGTAAAQQKAFALLSGPQRELYADVKKLQDGFHQLQEAMSPLVSRVADLAVKVATALLPAIKGLAGAGGNVLTQFFRPLLQLLQSDFFRGFIAQMSRLANQVAPAVGQAIVGLLKAFMQLFIQVGPAGASMLKGLLNLLVLWVQNLIPAVAWTVKITAAIGKWVAANKILAGSLIVVGAAVAIATGGLSVIIPAILAIIAALTYFWRTSQMFRDHVTRAFSDVGQVLATVAIVIVRTLQGLALSILDTIGSIIHVIADIPIIGTKMRPLANAFDTAYKAVKNFSDGAVGKLKNFNDFVARMPKVVKLEGNISDLQNKLATANAALKNPNLTATRKARIEANIAQLTAAIAAAKAQLASINGDIAKTYIYTYNVNAGGFKNVATGGITGAAAGGVQGGWRMVGEHGRELIKTAPGSYVHSNPDTERIMSQGGGGPQRVVLEWARGAGTTDKIIAALQEAVRIRGGDPAMFERKVAFR